MPLSLDIYFESVLQSRYNYFFSLPLIHIFHIFSLPTSTPQHPPHSLWLYPCIVSGRVTRYAKSLRCLSFQPTINVGEKKQETTNFQHQVFLSPWALEHVKFRQYFLPEISNRAGRKVGRNSYCSFRKFSRMKRTSAQLGGLQPPCPLPPASYVCVYRCKNTS